MAKKLTIREARAALYNHLYKSQHEFQLEMHIQGEIWRTANKIPRTEETRVSWSEYVQTGVIDHIIEKYL